MLCAVKELAKRMQAAVGYAEPWSGTTRPGTWAANVKKKSSPTLIGSGALRPVAPQMVDPPGPR